ncbi:GTP-binding protein Rho1 [Nowakowskiella sp. JEL0078]|nr:GTP-binding protein Rho1 [Nowakowskiella sp. JEL0078]
MTKNTVEYNKRKKLVIIGDGASGKTCLLIRFSQGTFPVEYIPTVFESWVNEISVGGQNFDLALWDTAGQEEYDKLRPLSYPNTDVVLITFAIDNLQSYEHVWTKWLDEIKQYCPGVPFLLIGCKTDLRIDAQVETVNPEEASGIAQRIGAKQYLECSAKEGDGVEEVFHEAILCTLETRNKKRDSRLSIGSKSLRMKKCVIV